MLAGEVETDSSCGGPDEHEIVRDYRVTLHVSRDGTVSVRDRALAHQQTIADPCHPLGRRPEGFADVTSRGSLRGHLARAMHHEADSVRAFTRFARELAAHRAPDELRDAAERAARDERRHAAMFARLLGTTPAIATDALPVRTLPELARENAIEGCVLETFSAVIAAHQGEHARSPRLRACFRRIARDEIEHAALAHAVRDWSYALLSSSDRDALNEAALEAKRELASTFRDPATDAEIMLGFPSARSAQTLLTACG